MKFISLLMALCLTLSSCTTYQPGSLKPLANVAILVAANKYAQKDVDNVGKILDLALVLELAADITGNTLSKEQFVTLVTKVDAEWSILGVALYNFYAENVTIPEKYSKHSAVLKELAATLRDSILGIPVVPIK